MKKYFILAIAIVLAFLLVRFIAYVMFIVIIAIVAAIIYFAITNWPKKENINE